MAEGMFLLMEAGHGDVRGRYKTREDAEAALARVLLVADPEDVFRVVQVQTPDVLPDE